MQVILLERVERLGTIGDEVSVKPGFARNFLLPTQKALRATVANRARFEAEREVLEARNAEQAEKARVEGSDLDGKTFIVIRNAGDTGQLYGSVSARDVADVVGDKVARSMVKLEQPIKALGVHDVNIRLHPEVTISVKVNVARTEEEAERQEAGEDVIQTQMEADRDDANEAQAERSELAADMFEGDFDADAIREDAGEPAGEAEE